jgi:hypothetical protein
MSRRLERITNAFGVECSAYDLSATHGVLVFDQHASECGRFAVDPVPYYGLTRPEVEALLAANDGIALYGEHTE